MSKPIKLSGIPTGKEEIRQVFAVAKPDETLAKEKRSKRPTRGCLSLARGDLLARYSFTSLDDNYLVSLILPSGCSRLDCLKEAYASRLAADRSLPIHADTFKILETIPAYCVPVGKSTLISLAAYIPASEGLEAGKLHQFIRLNRLTLPTIEDLTVACTMSFVNLGVHLIPDGKVVCASNGFLSVSPSGLFLYLNRLNRFDRDTNVSASAVLNEGQRSLRVSGLDSLFLRVRRWLGDKEDK